MVIATDVAAAYQMKIINSNNYKKPANPNKDWQAF